MEPSFHPHQLATFAGGCFWCTEAIFKRLNGVLEVLPGYSGGQRENPNYEQVSSGATGHAEAIQITFDPTVIHYDKLLDVFFATHDPTTKNRQGADVGTQYRSIIFYHTDEQKRQAEQKIQSLTQQNKYSDPIVTELLPFTHFYTAEDYHMNYYDKNPSQPYCQVVIDPKVRKLLEHFSTSVKEEYRKDFH